jgi:hypothetical protein
MLGHLLRRHSLGVEYRMECVITPSGHTVRPREVEKVPNSPLDRNSTGVQ